MIDGVIGPCDQKQWGRDIWSSGTLKKGGSAENVLQNKH